MLFSNKRVATALCAALTWCAFLGATAQATDLPNPDSPDYRELPLMIEETGTLYIKATVSRTQQSGDHQTTSRFETHARYNFAWDEESEAFRVNKNTALFKSSDAENAPPTDLTDMAALFKKLNTISYLADESLTPLAILDWPELKESLRKSFRSVATPVGTSPDVIFNQLYGNMDAETAAPYLLEIELFMAMPHNLGLEIGKPRIEDTPLMVPLGNFPLDAQTRITLTSWDEAQNSARIHYVFAPKPEALNYFIREHLPQSLRAANAPPQVIKTVEEAFESKSDNDLFDSKTECHFDMAIDTGLIRHGECSKRVHINMLEEVTTRTDHWTFSESFNP